MARDLYIFSSLLIIDIKHHTIEERFQITSHFLDQGIWCVEGKKTKFLEMKFNALTKLFSLMKVCVLRVNRTKSKKWKTKYFE